MKRGTMKPPMVKMPSMLGRAVRQSEDMVMDKHQMHIPTVSLPYKHPDDQVKGVKNGKK